MIWDTAAGVKSFPTPGHASHHVCYLLDDGTLLAGDATGVRILPGRHVLPHAPPPDIDLEAWERTFDDILRHQPERSGADPLRCRLGHRSGRGAHRAHAPLPRRVGEARVRRDDPGRVRRGRASGHRGERGRRRGRVFSGGSPRPVVSRAGALLAQERRAGCRSRRFRLRSTRCFGKAEPRGDRDAPRGRLTAHGGDLVRLGRRAHARQHGRHAPAPEEHAPRPARLAHVVLGGGAGTGR